MKCRHCKSRGVELEYSTAELDHQCIECGGLVHHGCRASVRDRWASFRGRKRSHVPCCTCCGAVVWQRADGTLNGCHHHEERVLDVVEVMERGIAKGLFELEDPFLQKGTL